MNTPTGVTKEGTVGRALMNIVFGASVGSVITDLGLDPGMPVAVLRALLAEHNTPTPDPPTLRPGLKVRRRSRSGATSTIITISEISVDGTRVRGTVGPNNRVIELPVNIYPDKWEQVGAVPVQEPTPDLPLFVNDLDTTGSPSAEPGRPVRFTGATCTTCGGTKRVMDRDSDDEFDTVPCPVCAVPNPESPEA